MKNSEVLKKENLRDWCCWMRRRWRLRECCDFFTTKLTKEKQSFTKIVLLHCGNLSVYSLDYEFPVSYYTKCSLVFLSELGALVVKLLTHFLYPITMLFDQRD